MHPRETKHVDMPASQHYDSTITTVVCCIVTIPKTVKPIAPNMETKLEISPDNKRGWRQPAREGRGGFRKHPARCSIVGLPLHDIATASQTLPRSRTGGGQRQERSITFVVQGSSPTQARGHARRGVPLHPRMLDITGAIPFDGRR